LAAVGIHAQVRIFQRHHGFVKVKGILGSSDAAPDQPINGNGLLKSFRIVVTQPSPFMI
jgi:hypothetical protein